MIIHYNRWLTDRIKNYLDNLDNKIKFLFDPFSSFEKMSSLFGLSKTFLITQRRLIHAKKVIAKSVLNSMSSSLKQRVEGWAKDYPELTELLFETCSKLISFIADYHSLLKPKPTPRYQMYDHHPNFNRDYFSEIIDPEQAYWLGFLIADGYISIDNKKSGDYYRMGIGLSEKDRAILFKFCEAIGLNPDYIHTRDVFCSYTNKRNPISEIRWGDQKFANDLIELGMQYETIEGKRVKEANMPNFESRTLALAFLLGFYDGDGTLGLNKKDKSIYPSIFSTNDVFLYQIKEYFRIANSVKTTNGQKYDFRRDKNVTTKLYSLYLGIPLFKNMLENYRESLERKRVSLERLEHYGISSTRYWLRKAFTKDLLQQMLDVVSPNKIGEILGVKGETISRFAVDVYGILIPKSAGDYMAIQHSIRNLGKNSQYYKSFFYWLNYLENLEKSRT